MMRKILLLGLGNDILCDDGIGLRIVREAARRLAKHSGVDTRESTEMGLALLDLITGYHDLVIVDSIQTHENPPGSVLEIHPSGLKVLPRKSPHFFGVGEVLALGRNLELVVPERVVIFAVEVLDPFTVTEEMTPPLRQALPGLVDRVMAAVLAMAEENEGRA